MDSMNRRVQKTKAALCQRPSQVTSVPTTPQNASHNDVTKGISMESNVTESVILSIGFLMSNKSLQSQVDTQLAELERINETVTKGRNKSQRGDPGNVWVVDWPQNFDQKPLK